MLCELSGNYKLDEINFKLSLHCLGIFEKLRKATLSCFIFVCPFAWNYWAPTGWELTKFCI